MRQRLSSSSRDRRRHISLEAGLSFQRSFGADFGVKTRATMRDVAREAGVSPMTVSRALRDDRSVSAKTRDMVRATADRLGYVYDTTAQAFRTQRSGFLAVTLPSINNANFAATHRALSAELSDTGLQMLLGVTGYDLAEEERLVRQLLARRPEAMILTGGTHSQDTNAVLRAQDAPIVEIWDLPAEPLGHVVGFSNADAMGKIIAHLAAQGRRRLAFLGAIGDSDRRGAERRRGAIEAARKLRLPEITLFDAGAAPVSMSGGARAVEEHSKRLSAFDALVCVSDPVAFGALNACRRLGISVPDDLAITGYGAFEIATVSEPAITTVDVFADRIGREAGAIVTKLLLESDVADRSFHIDTGARLVPGATS